MSIEKQIFEIKKVKQKKLLVGAAVGASSEEHRRAKRILKENLDLIVVDTAHAHTKKVSDIIKNDSKNKTKKNNIMCR